MINTVPTDSDTHYLVRKPNSKKLLIIFSATGTKKGMFNLWSLKDKVPHNLLFLRVPTNDWYQHGIPGLGDNHVDTIAAIRSIIAEHELSEVYTCGSSMGAYGALLYGAELNCNALAFSPEIILKLPHSRSTKMMPKDAQIHYKDIREKIKHSDSVFYIYTGELDPVDIYSADLVKNFGNVKVTTMPNDEHTVMRTLVSTSRLLPLLWSFTSDDKMPELDDNGDILSFSGFSSNFYRGWVAHQEKENTKAFDLLQKAVEIYPASPIAYQLLTDLCYRSRNYKDAMPYAALALSLNPEKLRNHLKFAHCYRRIGLLKQSKAMLLDIVKRWPESHHAHYEMTMVYKELKEKSRAIKHIKEAIKLDPSNQGFKKALESLTQ